VIEIGQRIVKAAEVEISYTGIVISQVAGFGVAIFLGDFDKAGKASTRIFKCNQKRILLKLLLCFPHLSHGSLFPRLADEVVVYVPTSSEQYDNGHSADDGLLVTLEKRCCLFFRLREIKKGIAFFLYQLSFYCHVCLS